VATEKSPWVGRRDILGIPGELHALKVVSNLAQFSAVLSRDFELKLANLSTSWWGVGSKVHATNS